MDVEKEIGIARLQVEQSFQSASHCTALWSDLQLLSSDFLLNLPVVRTQCQLPPSKLC